MDRPCALKRIHIEGRDEENWQSTNDSCSIEQGDSCTAN